MNTIRGMLSIGFVLLGFDVDPRATLAPHEVAAWEPVSPRVVIVRPGASPRAGAAEEVADLSGELERWFARARARVAIIRPDRFVYGVDGAGGDLIPPYLATRHPLPRASAAATGSTPCRSA